MPVGVTLDVLRKELRAETGQALNYLLHGTQSQETQDILLDRQQRELWDAYQWPHLRYWVDVEVYAGQQDYSYPSDMPFDQIHRIYIAPAKVEAGGTGWGAWQGLTYGIRATDIPAQGAPSGTPSRWANRVAVQSGMTNARGEIRLLPVPSHNMIMRLDGQAPCNDLSTDYAECVIDSKAIVLFAAAEILAVQKSESAALKLTKAQNYLRKLLVNQGADKRTSYNMGGNHRIDHLAVRPYAGVPGIGYIPS